MSWQCKNFSFTFMVRMLDFNCEFPLSAAQLSGFRHKEISMVLIELNIYVVI